MADEESSEAEETNVYKVASVDVEVSTETAVRVFTSDGIRERLENDSLTVAVLLCATRAEKVLSEMLLNRYGITPQEFNSMYGSQGLKTHFNKCNRLDLTDPNYREVLERLAKKRNRLVHNDGYLTTLEEDADERQEVREIVEQTCDWIETQNLRFDED